MVYNPMTCWSYNFFDECSEDILFEDMIERAEELPPCLVPSDVNPSSFRVIVVATENEGRERTAVFSSTAVMVLSTLISSSRPQTHRYYSS